MLVLGWALQHPSIFEHLIGTWPLHLCVDKQRSQHKGLAVAALVQGFLLQAGQHSTALQYDGSRPVWVTQARTALNPWTEVFLERCCSRGSQHLILVCSLCTRFKVVLMPSNLLPLGERSPVV